MKTVKWRILAITCMVCLLPILLGVALWKELPESMAIHFNIQNEPDSFSSKAFVVFGLPVLMAFLQMICCIINDLNEKKHGERKKLSTVTKWMIPVVTIVLQITTLVYNLGHQFEIHRVALLLLGGLFLVTGNYLPKLDYVKHYDLSTEKARKVNRFAGYLTAIMGILALIGMFLPSVVSAIWLVLLIPYGVINILYGIKVARS